MTRIVGWILIIVSLVVIPKMVDLSTWGVADSIAWVGILLTGAILAK